MIKSFVSVIEQLKAEGVSFRWFKARSGLRLIARYDNHHYMIGTIIDKNRLFIDDVRTEVSLGRVK